MYMRNYGTKSVLEMENKSNINGTFTEHVWNAQQMCTSSADVFLRMSPVDPHFSIFACHPSVLILLHAQVIIAAYAFGTKCTADH